MVFNWFRRQYNDSSETPSEQQQEETPPAPEPQSTTTPETAPETAADLLAFAKAAYKNIQQKQQSPVETAPDSAVTSTEPETVESPTTEIETVQTPELDANIAETTQVAPTAEIGELDPAIILENTEKSSEKDELSTSNFLVEEIAAVPDVSSRELTVNEAESPPSESTATNEPTQPTAPATLSFLERAAAERQAKQERLIASAIEVPAPEVVQPAAATSTATPETTAEIPGLDLMKDLSGQPKSWQPKVGVQKMFPLKKLPGSKNSAKV